MIVLTITIEMPDSNDKAGVSRVLRRMADHLDTQPHVSELHGCAIGTGTVGHVDVNDLEVK